MKKKVSIVHRMMTLINRSNNCYQPQDEEEEEGFMALFGGLAFANISSILSSTDTVIVEEEESSRNSSDEILITNSSKNTLKMYTTAAAGDTKDKKELNMTGRTLHHQQRRSEQQRKDGDCDHQEQQPPRTRICALSDTRINSSEVYQRAFQQSPVDGQLLKPSVQIFNMSHERRGNIMIASKSFSKGDIIFSERALEGVQMPRGICIKCKLSSQSGASNNSNHQLYKVRGCQQCFKSLEPASSCLFVPNNNSPLHSCDQNKNEALPLSHLWPIPEYVEGKNDETMTSGSYDHLKAFEDNDKLWVDSVGRVTCQRCSSIFCNLYCAKNHLEAVGDCCNVTDSIVELIHAIYCCDESNRSSAGGDDGIEVRKGIDADGYLDINPVLLLATRMFCVLVNRNRNAAVKGGLVNPFECLCGEEEDITPLRLGLLDSESGRYTMKSAYDAISSVLQLSGDECDTCFSLKVFHKTVAAAQRNAISLMTGSPFRTYYQAMIRETGGRGSARQKQVSSNIACALGSRDGNLTRNMDRIVEDKCVVKMGGIFTLASMMNHSCEPCAEIIGHEYVDCNIDVVAKRDIKKGEEITISYLGVQQKSFSAISRSRRQRELEARYLFTCTCSFCTQQFQ